MSGFRSIQQSHATLNIHHFGFVFLIPYLMPHLSTGITFPYKVLPCNEQTSSSSAPGSPDCSVRGGWQSRARRRAHRPQGVGHRAVQTTGIFVRKTWEDFPLPAEQFGAAIREVTLFSPARRPMRLVADHDEFRVGRMPWILLYLLEQCVRAGVRWMPSTRFVSADGNLVTIERAGRREQLQARVVVGADGPRSRVAQAFGLDRNSEFLVGVEDVVASRGGTPSLQCFLDPRLAPGYIAWVVDDGSEAHVGVAGYRNRFDPIASLTRFREIVNAGRAIERRGGLIPVNGILRRIGNERALLVGDAAGAVSPLTAGGIDAALRLSSFAAETVANGEMQQYSGDQFRTRFVARRWMRRTIAAVSHPLVIELGMRADAPSAAP